ncbi:MAG TPA: polysaccharide deacetylase family protein, partial [Roseiflexaceae bacterium]|nr:polysaccharide deacetylase family protein [Roseiflexaceae bacterium]
MTPNPALLRLGFAADDRVAIIHADDIGMCQASVAAYADLAAFGLISSAAVMVPCGWFPAAAALGRANPDYDLGVHLTLTCEWDAYRWGPISTRDPETGLLDAEGCFFRSTAEAQAHGRPEAVAIELAAQLDRALAAGMRPTHIDTHMGVVYSAGFLPAYLDVARRYRLPPMFFRHDEAGWRALGADADTASQMAHFSRQLEDQGVPLIDHIFMMPLDAANDRIGQARRAFEALQPGLTHFILHPSQDTAELRALGHDWPSRVADYQAFMSEQLRADLHASGVHAIGYRALQELMP